MLIGNQSNCFSVEQRCHVTLAEGPWSAQSAIGYRKRFWCDVTHEFRHPLRWPRICLVRSLCKVLFRECITQFISPEKGMSSLLQQILDPFETVRWMSGLSLRLRNGRPRISRAAVRRSSNHSKNATPYGGVKEVRVASFPSFCTSSVGIRRAKAR
jgi:hypothetical protein